MVNQGKRLEFGDKSRFAITVVLDENHGGTWLFGRLCYWIGDRQVGNFDEVVSLGDVLTAITWIVGDCGSREHCLLFGSPEEKAFSLIDNALYCDEQTLQSNPDAMNEEETPAGFDICIRMNVFNGWKIYLVECGSKARILYRESGGEIQEFALLGGEFDAAIKATQQLIEAWNAREAASAAPGRPDAAGSDPTLTLGPTGASAAWPILEA